MTTKEKVIDELEKTKKCATFLFENGGSEGAIYPLINACWYKLHNRKTQLENFVNTIDEFEPPVVAPTPILGTPNL